MTGNGGARLEIGLITINRYGMTGRGMLGRIRKIICRMAARTFTGTTQIMTGSITDIGADSKVGPSIGSAVNQAAVVGNITMTIDTGVVMFIGKSHVSDKTCMTVVTVITLTRLFRRRS